jgi:hypothetical protein
MIQTFVICPKHGKHEHSIVSRIEGHEGVWCQICWLESLGPTMPSEQVPFELKLDNDVADKKVYRKYT